MLVSLLSIVLAAAAPQGAGPNRVYCEVEAERRGDGPPSVLRLDCPDDFEGHEALQAAADAAIAGVDLGLNRRGRFALAPAVVFIRDPNRGWRAADEQMLIRPMFLVPPQEFMRRPRHYRCDYEVWPGSDGRGDNMQMTCYAGESTRPSRPAQRTMEDFVRSTRWMPTGTRFCFTHSEIGEVDGVNSRGQTESGEPLNPLVYFPEYCAGE